jgi:oxygen-independent coproporphyrinogen-3 oxidase
MRAYLLSAEERAVYRHYAALALPRHNSYPAAAAWTTAYGPEDLRTDLRRSAARHRPLSLYVHVPFCQQSCYYGAGTREFIAADQRAAHDPAEDLLRGLEREAQRFAALVGPGKVRAVHLGGSSPTFLHPGQLERLWEILRCRFTIAWDAEVAVEIDPRSTTREHLQTLRALGFNQVSLGIQDFDPAVQQATGRLQSFELVECVVAWCRELSFHSVHFDLCYGLPRQTLASMDDTLDRALALWPDRVAFFRLKAIPEIFRGPNAFTPGDLPAGDLLLDLDLLASNRLLEAGYDFIGLDLFARPGEAQARALQDSSLQRTFQAMTTGKALDVLGLGPSAISQLDEAFAQNVDASADWQEAVGRDLATERGLRLDADDQVRRELLQQLYGSGVIDKRALEKPLGIAFDHYFADELGRLCELAEQGLVTVESDTVRLTAPLGRLLVRVVAAVFDRYLPAQAFREGVSENPSSSVG